MLYAATTACRSFTGEDYKIKGEEAGCADRLFNAYGPPLVQQRARGAFVETTCLDCTEPGSAAQRFWAPTAAGDMAGSGTVRMFRDAGTHRVDA